MKKKLLLTLLAIVCALCCALGFAACDPKPSEPPHRHNYVYVDNGDGTHHEHCTNDGCDAPDVNPQKHVWLDGYCIACRAEYDPSIHRHVWEETWHHDYTHHWHNCTADNCDVTDNAQKSGYGEHSYGADSNCVCGKRNPAVPSEGLQYGLEQDDTVLISGIDNTDVTDIVIPAEHNGKPVTSIRWEAFKSCYSLQSVTLPDSLKSIGRNAFSNCRALAYIALPDGLTSIGDGAFFECRSLTEITIPDSVGGLGEDVFYGCKSLTDVTIGSGVPSLQRREFFQCSSLTSVTVPDHVTSIGALCFNGCNALESVTIGSGVASIGEEAFTDCGALKTVTFAENSNLKNVHEKAFKDVAIVTATIPSVACSYIKNSALKTVTINGGTSIPDSAFSSCSSLKSVIIGDSVTSIGTFAFRDCTSLKSITIPADVTVIKESAFSGCRGLTNVTFAENSELKTIEYGAFTDCSNYGFTKITIPDSVTKIGENAFYGCSNLEKLTIGSSVESIGQSAFYNCGWLRYIYYTGNVAGWCRINGLDNITTVSNRTLYIDGKKVEGELVIPDGVTSIANYAFYRFFSINSVVVGEDVTSIGNYAFGDCGGFSSVTLGSNVKNIYLDAFVSHTYSHAIDKVIYTGDIEDWCKVSGLRYIMQEGKTLYIDGKEVAGEFVIPTSITSIPEYAFYECESLTSVTIPTSVTSVGSNAFLGYSLTVYCETATTPDGWNSSWTSHFVPVVWDCKNNDKDRSHYAYAVIDGIRYSLSDYNTTATVIQQPQNIVTANIPATVIYKGATYKVDMNPGAFNRCNLLESITVDADIENYASQDGILYNKDKTEFVHVPKSIKGSVTIPDGMTGIDASALSGCELLTDVIIPSSVTSIASNAFGGCTGLTSVTIPDSVTSVGVFAFDECVATLYCESAAQPDGWEENWDMYFNGAVVWDCKNNNTDADGYQYAVIEGIRYALKDGSAIVVRQPQNITAANILDTVTYKDVTYNVTGIAPYAFANCGALQYNEYGNALYLGNSTDPYVVLVKIKDTLITSCTVHENTKYIYDRAFFGCSNLTSVVLPDTLISIASEAFASCRSLTSVAIGNNVTTIGDNAFNWCDSLTSVTIGNSVTTIGAQAFSSCSNLTSLTLPESVVSVGRRLIDGCVLLTVYCEAASQPDGWANDWNDIDNPLPVVWNCKTNDKDESGYAHATIDGIRYSLKDGEATAERQVKTVTTVNIPATVTYKGSTYKVTTVSSSAFWNCNSLTKVTIGDKVTTIMNDAFNMCELLAEVTLGSGVTRIERGAFSRCESLTEITFNGTKAQWNNIFKEYDWEPGADCIIRCKDGNLKARGY